MNIYVGNLATQATEDDVRELFEAHGQIASVVVIKDKFTGESRGFGFVEMPAKAEALAAMESLNGHDLMGKKIVLNEARPRKDNRRGGGSGGGGGRQGGGRRRFF
ncbi:RNA-binding protein [candidate division KSB1 bacterium]|nr:RNA-binding protein [candidate division KSB1 bacterium]